MYVEELLQSTPESRLHKLIMYAGLNPQHKFCYRLRRVLKDANKFGGYELTYRSKGGLGLTRLLVQTLFGLIVGVILSICALLVQIFLVLLGRKASSTEEFSRNAQALHVSGCSLCAHRSRLDAGVQSTRIQSET